MDFLAAMKVVVEGGRISRESWQDRRHYVSMINGLLCLKKEDGAHSWLISSDDIEADDWQVWSILKKGAEMPGVEGLQDNT